MGTTKRKDTVPALKLTLGGAPLTWHIVDGLLGMYHPEIPTPVGGPQECPLDIAQEASDREGAPVELVYITEAQAEKSRDLLAPELSAAAAALRSAAPDATKQQIDATIDSLAGPGVSSAATDNSEEA